MEVEAVTAVPEFALEAFGAVTGNDIGGFGVNGVVGVGGSELLAVVCFFDLRLVAVFFLPFAVVVEVVCEIEVDAVTTGREGELLFEVAVFLDFGGGIFLMNVFFSSFFGSLSIFLFSFSSNRSCI